MWNSYKLSEESEWLERLDPFWNEHHHLTSRHATHASFSCGTTLYEAALPTLYESSDPLFFLHACTSFIRHEARQYSSLSIVWLITPSNRLIPINIILIQRFIPLFSLFARLQNRQALIADGRPMCMNDALTLRTTLICTARVSSGSAAK